MTDSVSKIPSPDTSKPPRRRRWIPLSLRLFTAVLAFLGLGSALWIGIPAYRQHVAIRYFRGLGVEVDTDGGGIRPEWLLRWIDPRRLEPLEKVTRFDLSGFDLSDADVVYLKGLNGLEWLALNRNAITDTGIRHLAGVSSLKALRIENTQVTDDGLVHLTGLKRLEVLSLKRTLVTGSGVMHLKGLPRLRYLDLDGTLVDDAALESFKGLNHIRELRLCDTLISEDGLAHLHGLKTLEHLRLGDLRASPRAVAAVASAIPGLDVSYEWNYTLRNRNGEPTLETDWVDLIYEGGKFSGEYSGKFLVSGHITTGPKTTFYMGGFGSPKYRAEFSWSHRNRLTLVDFAATSRDNPSTTMRWLAEITDCGRTLSCRGRTIQLPNDNTTVVFGRDESVRVNGWPVPQEAEHP